VLQFDRRSVTVVGLVRGITFIVAGLQEFVTAAMPSNGWRWLWMAFGVLQPGSGILALFTPVQTVADVTSILGYVYMLIGTGWTVQAFAPMENSYLTPPAAGSGARVVVTCRVAW
jgi:uncharacterized membrane protein HdeD (DUF308 family)